MTLEMLVALAAAVISLLVSILGYLVTRLLNRIESKLDSLATTDAQQDRALVELRVRTSHLEAEQASARQWREDMGGFLSGLGYRKRDGPVPAK